MKTIKLCDNDLFSAIRAASKFQILLPPKDMSFSVGLEVDDKLYKKITNDSRLAEEIFGDISKLYKEGVKLLVAEGNAIEKEFFSKSKPKAWVATQWKKRAPEVLAPIQKKMEAKALKRVADWQKVQGDATKYVVKCVFKTTVGTLGVATATLGTVVAFGAGGGAGGGVAIYGLVKAVIALGKEINKLRKDVDQAEHDLQKNATALQALYKDKSRGKTGIREAGAEFFNSLSPVEVKSVNTVSGHYDSFKGKLDRVDKKLSATAVKLNDILDAQEDLQKEITVKVEKMLATRGYNSKKLPKLQGTMRKMRFETVKMIAEVGDSIGRMDNARKRQATYKKMVDQLKSQKPGWVKIVEVGITLGDLALGAAFTDFSKLDQVLVLVDTVGVEIDAMLAEEI
ncbi:MAG: flagellar biosynthesis chaperone FliJ [Phycisphaerales bacterium]|jgi:flagellar biosynthesis chaperone FliJ